MSFVRVCSLFLAILSLAACSSVTDSDDAGSLEASATIGMVRLTNRSSMPVYYVPLEAETASASLLVPCTDRDRCAHVDPGESVTLRNSAFGGYEPGDKHGLVLWWHLTGANPEEDLKDARNLHGLPVDFQ